MELTISHDFRDESLESKAKWFKSLSVEERMDFLCEIFDMILETNPRFIKRIHAQPTSRRVRVLTKA